MLVDLGGTQAADETGDGMTQLVDENGRLFTLFERVPEGTDWEVREGPFAAATGARLPDMRTVVACPFDCRWPDLAVRVAASVARAAEVPTWLLDGDGVVWGAEAVDPRRVRL